MFSLTRRPRRRHRAAVPASLPTLSLLTRRPRRAAPAPAPVVYTLDPDYAYRAAWGLTLGEWLDLDDAARRARRDRVVFAPHFHTATATAS